MGGVGLALCNSILAEAIEVKEFSTKIVKIVLSGRVGRETTQLPDSLTKVEKVAEAVSI